ncbi:cell division control protein 14 [Savitreella phatthalungensis]
MKGKVGMGEHTKDAVYIDADRRFKELETETKRLHEDAKKYSQAVNGMLDHQVQFAEAVKDIYKPISGRMSDASTLVPEGNPEGIEACEQYQEIVRELKETLAPELEMIETRIVLPAQELLEIFKQVKKVMTKNEHKLVDYDRHRATLKKLQDKKEKTLKDEKALYRAEADVEASTQEYEYYNEMLKEELPKLFALESEFIRPLFQNLYYMQLNIFYTLNERMARCDIPYFQLDRDIVEAFTEKRGDVQEQAEKIPVVKFKLAKPPSRFERPGTAGSKKAGEARASSDAQSEDLPAYTPVGAGAASSSAAVGRTSSVTGKKPPPPPPSKPSALAKKKEVARALYDYTAQADGDLSFKAGDAIEVVQRTDSENDWWTGKLNGVQGVFPGNYVQLELQ